MYSIETTKVFAWASRVVGGGGNSWVWLQAAVVTPPAMLTEATN